MLMNKSVAVTVLRSWSPCCDPPNLIFLAVRLLSSEPESMGRIF